MNPLYHRFYQRINDVPRLLGIPVGEAIPTVCIFFFLMYEGKMVLGLLLSAAFFSGVRLLKQGKSRKWITVLAYWYLPEFVLPIFFWLPLKVTSPSYKRHWLS